MSEFYEFVSEAKLSLDKNKVKELLKFIDKKFDSGFSNEVQIKSAEATSTYKSWDMNFDDEIQKFIDRECEEKFPELTFYAWGKKVPEGLRREKMQVYIEIKPNAEKPKEKQMDDSVVKSIFKDLDNKFDIEFSEDLIIKKDSAHSTIKSWTMDLDSKIEDYLDDLRKEYPIYNIEVYGNNAKEGLNRWKRAVQVEITPKPIKSTEEPKELTQRQKDEIERKQKEWENHNDNVRKRNKGEF